MGHQLATLFPIALLVATSVSADEIRDFTSDGCSAFPDGTYEEKELWHSCCVVHDLAYWVGGSADEREAADQALKTCVEAVGKPAIAGLMLAGVRVGGTPWLPTQFRWAYGWPYLRGYRQVSDEEAEQVKQKMQAALKLVEDQRPKSQEDGN
jgi:hypothetical protein